MSQMTERAGVSRWLAGYEAAWRTPGTGSLAGLFTEDATYLQSPYEPPVAGLDAIGRMWEAEREGPDEVFTLATDILAVDGWVIRFAGDGHCTWFEEWPFWPQQPHAEPADPA